MQRLSKVIGQAPSEISFQALLERVEKERDRVRAALQDFRDQAFIKPKKAKAKKQSADKALKEIMRGLEAAGLTQEQIIELLKKGA